MFSFWGAFVGVTARTHALFLQGRTMSCSTVDAKEARAIDAKPGRQWQRGARKR